MQSGATYVWMVLFVVAFMLAGIVGSVYLVKYLIERTFRSDYSRKSTSDETDR